MTKFEIGKIIKNNGLDKNERNDSNAKLNKDQFTSTILIIIIAIASSGVIVSNIIWWRNGQGQYNSGIEQGFENGYDNGYRDGFGNGSYEPPIDYSFHPIIDGKWDNQDNWNNSRFRYTEYIIPNNTMHYSAFNYFYVDWIDEEGKLYILCDMVSDITNETWDEFAIFPEFINIVIDTDCNRGNYSSSEWDSEEIGVGAEAFVYIPYTDEFSTSFLTGHDMSLNEDDCVVKLGFQKTINGLVNHRIYEIYINLTSLNNWNEENFGIAFEGYGTLDSIAGYNIWGSPTYWVYDLYMDGRINENAFYRIGTNWENWNLNHVPEGI